MKTPLSPQKLLLSKWTAVTPHNRERHFIVTRIVESQLPGATPVEVELEAVLTKRSVILPWRSLTNAGHWLQGWR